jgi:hypothetical protein
MVWMKSDAICQINNVLVYLRLQELNIVLLYYMLNYKYIFCAVQYVSKHFTFLQFVDIEYKSIYIDY